MLDIWISACSGQIEKYILLDANTKYMYTVFHQMNALGAEADNEHMTLANFNEFDNMDPYVPKLEALKVWFRYVK